jgi:hypothetical protein
MSTTRILKDSSWLVSAVGKPGLNSPSAAAGAAGVSTTGAAGAARREAIHNLGGLFDTAVLGSADRHMALSFIEKGHLAYPKGISKGYVEQLQLWEDRCKKHIRKNVGHMPGSLMHYWHGKKADRRYQDRWKILVKHKYDPEFDLKLDEQGLYQYTGNKPDMEYDIRRYFMARNEDSIDME